ncbi:fructose-1-phosphate phosphatase YqaB [mine drainage metagenome]|uniref:Fructose-1-phosphate phosphatase YqaB n=1 Tax=mine drainage metagenome TaxID=410659 RepID=A0A1J5PRU7_9ZZZZ
MYDDYAALIFDMDGTLVDSGQLHEFSWTATLNKYGIPIDGPLMRSLAGVPTKETLELLIQKFNGKVQGSVHEMNEFKEQCVRDNLHRFVQATALIDVVKKYHGIKPMAIGTGANTPEARLVLKQCGLDKYLDVVVGADQVKNPKPAPDTFLRCAELLGVDAKQCVVFEDSKLGLQAAARAGMAGIDVLLIHNIYNDYF